VSEMIEDIQKDNACQLFEMLAAEVAEEKEVF